ncbi:hypothetical protein EC919_10698 [Pseudomonas graminis]|uniref:Ig-like domain repeat protein n=1 Tax=Pseudomonas graminis TaxID=158627 RepID=UPI00105B9811|nr:Ig-like domain repeat protein [Pseudomonas graminis]TDV51221.1 hypothetical protein EC919_10698 [Pseudomonas graminis]
MSTHEARSVEVEVLDGEKVIGTAPTEANGSWTYTVSPFSEGIHSFTARAGGNTSEKYTVVGGASELPIKEDFEDIPVGELVRDVTVTNPKTLTAITLRQGDAQISIYSTHRNCLLIHSGAMIEIVPASPATSVAFLRLEDSENVRITYYDNSGFFVGEILSPKIGKVEFSSTTPISLIEIDVTSGHFREVIDDFEFS